MTYRVDQENITGNIGSIHYQSQSPLHRQTPLFLCLQHILPTLSVPWCLLYLDAVWMQTAAAEEEQPLHSVPCAAPGSASGIEESHVYV